MGKNHTIEFICMHITRISQVETTLTSFHNVVYTFLSSKRSKFSNITEWLAQQRTEFV